MSKKAIAHPRFKPYDQGQLQFLPLNLDEIVRAKDPARIINKVVDSLNLDVIYQQYARTGRPGYHPRMMFKLLVYGYLCNVYSSRGLEELCYSSVQMMWLVQQQKPDHNSINRFRLDLEDSLKKVFQQVVELLYKAGLVDLKQAFVDGTKVEANANRYTFVWAAAVNRHRTNLIENVNTLLDYAKTVASEELKQVEALDTQAITPEQLQATIQTIQQALDGKEIDEKKGADIKKAAKTYPARLANYDKQRQILGDRGSYSKTDPGASFMRTKDDHLQNGQLKPCYNVQLSTQNQCVLNYGVSANANDSVALIEHVDELIEITSGRLQAVCADAGYGSQQNYTHLEQKGVEAYVKYQDFDHEQGLSTKPRKQKHFAAETFFYNAEEDFFVCPMGQKMFYSGEQKTVTKTGFEQHARIYLAQRCQGCPLRGQCHPHTGNRKITVNRPLERLKKEARERLLSEEGVRLRKQRNIDVESTFGNIKANHGFTRFRLRGHNKVAIELGLLAIAQNMRKLAS